MVAPNLTTRPVEFDVFPTFQHDGNELLYLLGGEQFRLMPGNSLFFDGKPPAR